MRLHQEHSMYVSGLIVVMQWMIWHCRFVDLGLRALSLRIPTLNPETLNSEP